MSPVLVLGTGRSGTSVVARVLHERLGVSMGERLPGPSGANPRGAYEDLAFREIHIDHLAGRLSRQVLEARIEELIAAREPPWGLKDPRLCHLLDVYLPRLPDAELVVCDRQIDACARSAARVTTASREEALGEMQTRKRKLDRAMNGRGHLKLDMNARREEDELERTLTAYLGRRSTLAGDVV